MSNFNKSDPQVSKLTLPSLTNILLFGNPSFSDTYQHTYQVNTLILDATIEYILSYIVIQYIKFYILVVFNQTLLIKTSFIFFLQL